MNPPVSNSPSSGRASVLMVEDTTRLAESIRRGLTEEGFRVEVVDNGRAAIQRMLARDLDGVILDLGLPDIDGTHVLEQVRAQGLAIPILVLTARDAVTARVQALECGADDYLIKPFAFEELLARLRALLRRARAPRWAPLTFEDIELLPDSHTCKIGERTVRLSPRECALLELFLRRRGELLSRRDILSAAFGYDFDPGTNIVDVHVTHLRRKLEGSHVVLEAVRGSGYRVRASADPT
ncbi:MAG: response regulator transcription factor [Polyangiaceae bacterium]